MAKHSHTHGTFFLFVGVKNFRQAFGIQQFEEQPQATRTNVLAAGQHIVYIAYPVQVRVVHVTEACPHMLCALEGRAVFRPETRCHSSTTQWLPNAHPIQLRHHIANQTARRRRRRLQCTSKYFQR